MSLRVQVILDEKEREVFRHEAEAEGLSLSAWLRKAGRERIQRRTEKDGIKSPRDLKQFFRACDAREKGQEPDWDQHILVIHRSKSSGESGT